MAQEVNNFRQLSRENAKRFLGQENQRFSLVAEPASARERADG